MKKFTLISTITAICLLFSTLGFAQKFDHDHSDPNHRCGTMIAQEAFFNANPGTREAFQIQQQAFQQLLQARNGQRVAALNVTIPVAVHVVAANPNLMTVGQIQRQIDILNIDYSGLNADSGNNNAAWASRRGHSGIRFVLAKRDPSGNCTNGITRTVSNVTAFGTAGTATANIKRTALQGRDGWDPTKYFNMWVGPIGGGILGYATFPGGPVADQGIVCSPEFFGEAITSCVPPSAYSGGRTLTHEVGHYLNLFHTFQGGCAGGDQVAETPALSGPTFGAPVGVLATGLCSGEPNPPGVMYQNYMDYTDDVAMTMFVNEQVIRMETAMALPDRVGLQTSNGGTAIGANDAAVTGYLGLPKSCNPINAGCGSASVTPRIIIKNNGTASITAAVITAKLNGVLIQTINYTKPGGLAVDKMDTVGFNLAALTVSPSVFDFEITTVNGGADVCPNTNIYTETYTVAFSPIVAMPVNQGFETVALPNGWSIATTPAGPTGAWTRRAPGGFGASTSSMFVDNFDPDTRGTTSEIRTPRINTAVAVSPVKLKFDLSYAFFNATFADRLIVLASTDCGATFTQLFNESGATLAAGTGGAVTAAAFVPTAAQWRTVNLTIPPAIVTAGNVLFAFRHVGGFGNNMYIDNINVSETPARDLAVNSINTPANVTCVNTVVPNVTIANVGVQAITSYSVSYSIDGGTAITIPGPTAILAGASSTFNLPVSPTFAAGPHSIAVSLTNVTSALGTGDLNAVNDLLSKAFTLRPIFSGVVANDFEAPVNTIANPYPNTFVLTTAPAISPAFVRARPGYLSDWSFFINNWDFNRTGSADAMQFPALSTIGADSVSFEFDIAGRGFTGAEDSIILQISNNCGVSFINTPFATRGAGISGVATSGAGNFVPTTAQWRHYNIRFGGASVSNGSVLFRFLHKGVFGDNIYIDNINIKALYKRNIAVAKIVSPGLNACTLSNAATITVKNEGLETITGFTAAHTVNGGTPVVSTFTGLTLAPGASANYTLNNIVFPSIGTFIVKMYTYSPVAASGTGDEFLSNDTITIPVGVTSTVAAPLAENFEGAVYPPVGWAIVNPNADLTWTRANYGYGSGTVRRSASLTNRTYVGADGRVDHLITPTITYPATTDSLFLTFDLSASSFGYPGATNVKMDTLEVLYTKDCGVTMTSIYKKWGIELETSSDPNTPSNSAFFPDSSATWRNEKINLTSLTAGGSLQFIFRNISNNGNNVYLDNINLNTIVVPAKVKTLGYMITPTVNNGNFEIRHYRTPATLTSAEVYNAAGQLMWRKNYVLGTAPAYINVDITRFAAGIYSLRLNYSDKKVTERIIKQ